MQQVSMRFGAILHPVREHPVTKQPDRGPVRHVERFPSGGYSESFDTFQHQSARNYASEAILAYGQKARVAEGHGERRYTLTDEDAAAMEERLKTDRHLRQLNRKIKRLRTVLEAARESRDTHRRDIVQTYLDQHRDRIQEVPYKWDYLREPPPPPKPVVQQAKQAGNLLVRLLTGRWGS